VKPPCDSECLELRKKSLKEPVDHESLATVPGPGPRSAGAAAGGLCSVPGPDPATKAAAASARGRRPAASLRLTPAEPEADSELRVGDRPSQPLTRRLAAAATARAVSMIRNETQAAPT
jgi:hypothetical protein